MVRLSARYAGAAKMIASLAWHWPEMLVLLAVPAAVWVLRQRLATRSTLANFAAQDLWPYLITAAVRKTSPHLYVAAWCLACIGAAGPYLIRIDASAQPIHSADVVFVVDISPSMDARDAAPSRLQRAKWWLQRVIAASPQHRFGLVAYSANAYPVLPLTQDLAVLNHFSDALNSELARQSGSNLARGLERAVALLESGGTLIVFSDGETHTPGLKNALDVLKRNKISVSTVTIGTRQGAPVLTRTGALLEYRGEVVISQADAATLADIATSTGGIAIVDDRATLADFTPLLSHLESVARERTLASPGLRYELFPWFLLPSLLLVCVGLHRARILVFAGLLLSLLVPKPSFAAPWTDEQARRAFQRGDWDQARTLYRSIAGYTGKMGEGAVAFRLNQWETAISAFNDALRLADDAAEQAMASYNLGNAYARANRFTQARDAYRTALRLQPNFPRATRNLNLVTEWERIPAPAIPAQGSTSPPPTGANTARPVSSQDGTTESNTTDSTTATSSIQATALTQENTALLLQRRFLQRDALDQLSRSEDKPW